MLLTWTKRPSRRLLEAVRSGDVHPDDAVAELRRLPFADLGFARVDHHRALRQGLPEAVYGPGKTPEQCAAIVGELLDGGAVARAAHPRRPTSRPPPRSPPTRTARSTAPRSCGARRRRGPSGSWSPRPAPPTCPWPTSAPTVLERLRHRARSGSPTSAWPASTACSARPTPWPAPTPSSWSPAWRARWPAWSAASRRRPVVAVPTSVGYGASLEGVTALLAMLASCAAGLTVVGIDNGYGAACAVAPDAASERRRDRLAWFHCFSGIAGDMALGVALDAGADVDEVRSMVERLPVHGWALEAEPVLRGGIAATKAHVHAEETTVVRTASHIAALVEEARLPDRVRRPGPGRVRGAGRGRGPAAPPAARAGALPRGRRPRRHRRRRRHLRRARGARRSTTSTRSVVVTGTGMVRSRPRAAPEPGAGGRRAARRGRRAHPRASTSASSSPRRPAPRSLAALASGLRAAAADDHRAQRLRRRHPRPRRSAERHPGRDRRRRATRCSAASRSWCSRSTSTTPPARRSPTPSARCSTPAPTTPGSRRSS